MTTQDFINKLITLTNDAEIKGIIPDGCTIVLDPFGCKIYDSCTKLATHMTTRKTDGFGVIYSTVPDGKDPYHIVFTPSY